MFLSKEMSECIYESFVDGQGIRLVVFLNGCEHKCKGCQNPQTWDMYSGKNFPVEMIAKFINEKLIEGKGYYQGITFSGGDPLYQSKELNDLILLLKRDNPDIDIWCYTGFKYEEIKDLEVIRNIDVLVDGKYEEAKKCFDKPFRGSSNQRVISLKDGAVIKID